MHKLKDKKLKGNYIKMAIYNVYKTDSIIDICEKQYNSIIKIKNYNFIKLNTIYIRCLKKYIIVILFNNLLYYQK